MTNFHHAAPAPPILRCDTPRLAVLLRDSLEGLLKVGCLGFDYKLSDKDQAVSILRLSGIALPPHVSSWVRAVASDKRHGGINTTHALQSTACTVHSMQGMETTRTARPPQDGVPA